MRPRLRLLISLDTKGGQGWPGSDDLWQARYNLPCLTAKASHNNSPNEMAHGLYQLYGHQTERNVKHDAFCFKTFVKREKECVELFEAQDTHKKYRSATISDRLMLRVKT
jgi:hypothetical protein